VRKQSEEEAQKLKKNKTLLKKKLKEIGDSTSINDNIILKNDNQDVEVDLTNGATLEITESENKVIDFSCYLK
jgi:hypothetical protein